MIGSLRRQADFDLDDFAPSANCHGPCHYDIATAGIGHNDNHDDGGRGFG